MENICAQQLDLTGLVSMRWFPKENASNVAALSNTRWCSTGLLSHELNMSGGREMVCPETGG